MEASWTARSRPPSTSTRTTPCARSSSLLTPSQRWLSTISTTVILQDVSYGDLGLEKWRNKKGFFDVKLQSLLWDSKLKCEEWGCSINSLGWRVGFRLKKGWFRFKSEEWMDMFFSSTPESKHRFQQYQPPPHPPTAPNPRRKMRLGGGGVVRGLNIF